MMKELSRERLAAILQVERLETVSSAHLRDLFRRDEQLAQFCPEGAYPVDPRDGAVILYSSARARRPHDYPIPARAGQPSGPCPVCAGSTTGVIDVAELSEGFTFINKNLFPVLYPQESPTGGDSPFGLHFLQWTSSRHDHDWHNMPGPDRVIVLERLAALEQKLLLESDGWMPCSSAPDDAKTTYGYVSIFKNYGLLVGGSLSHGHQQICFSNVRPRRVEDHWRFRQERGEVFSAYLLRENPPNLTVRDYGPATLLVSYFMKRPYGMMLLLKAAGRRYLHDLTPAELAAIADGWHDAIHAMRAVMPQIGRETAYNVILHNGPDFYVEFLPYTQEIGGIEQLGLWVCQSNPQEVAARLREILPPARTLLQ
jgi:galactose-1-phosphate uridylyltransferase